MEKRPRKPAGWLGGKTRKGLKVAGAWAAGNAVDYGVYEGLRAYKVPKPLAWVGSDIAGIGAGYASYKMFGKKPKKVAQTGFPGGGGRSR